MYWDFSYKTNQDIATCFVLFSGGAACFAHTASTPAVYMMVMNLFPNGFFSSVFKNKTVSSNDKRLPDVFSF